MKCFNKKQWLLPWITGSCIIMSLTEVAHAQKQPVEQPISSPLPPNDPAAQLDPSLLNVPPMPEPKIDSSSTFCGTQSPAKEVSYDVRTGSTQVGASRPLQCSSSPSFTPPNMGADSNIDPEPPRSVDLQ